MTSRWIRPLLLGAALVLGGAIHANAESFTFTASDLIIPYIAPQPQDLPYWNIDFRASFTVERTNAPLSSADQQQGVVFWGQITDWDFFLDAGAGPIVTMANGGTGTYGFTGPMAFHYTPASSYLVGDPLVQVVAWGPTGLSLLTAPWMRPNSTDPNAQMGTWAGDIINAPCPFCTTITDSDANRAVRIRALFYGTEVPAATPVPEPATLLLLGSGLFGAARLRRR